TPPRGARRPSLVTEAKPRRTSGARRPSLATTARLAPTAGSIRTAAAPSKWSATANPRPARADCAVDDPERASTASPSVHNIAESPPGRDLPRFDAPQGLDSIAVTGHRLLPPSIPTP